MTTERFTLAYADYDWWAICDKENPTELGISGEDVVDLLNELHEENQIKLEIVDAFIRGLEDEKGIDSENKEFQCRMNHTIKVLKKLKEEMLDPTDFKRVKELGE